MLRALFQNIEFRFKLIISSYSANCLLLVPVHENLSEVSSQVLPIESSIMCQFSLGE